MENFTRPQNEKPYYYASTVENGIVVEHDGEEEHAMYLSEMNESIRRANLWHEWVEKNVKNAYDSMGILDNGVIERFEPIYQTFMRGEIPGQ
jgi:hypothetical protein